MKRTFLIIPTIIVFVLVAGIISIPFIIKSNKTGNIIIGGDKDEHGCILSAGYSWNEKLKECVRPWEIENRTYCEDPRPEICTMEYIPVCGIYSKKIQCIKAPCGKTYSNGCSACSDEKVEYHTEGKCNE